MHQIAVDTAFTKMTAKKWIKRHVERAIADI